MRALLLAFAATAVLGSPALAAADNDGTPSELRSVVTRLLQAEVAGDGTGACAVLNAPLTTTVGGRTCAQRWDARLARLLAAQGGARRLRADLAAVPHAAIAMDGEHASIRLPHPLLDGHSRFYWTANCWMLTR